MLLICVYTMHHFLIRWNHTCCVVTVLSTVIQQSKLSLSLFFVIFLRSKIQNICCIKNTDIFGYVAYIHESQKITHHLNALLWFPRHYEGLRGAYAHLRTLADLAASCWRLLKCIVCAAEEGCWLGGLGQTWNLSKNLHCRILKLKILHRQFHLISTVFVGKNTKNEWKWRNLLRWQKFYTAAGTDGMDKFHLWVGVRVGRVTVKEGGWRCVEIFIYYFFTTA